MKKKDILTTYNVYVEVTDTGRLKKYGEYNKNEKNMYGPYKKAKIIIFID